PYLHDALPIYTNRKAIYVNRLMTVGIVDMSKEESAPLLKAVFDHAERREFVYEHVWRAGELLLWDNRCSSHARTDFPSTQRRLMWRTTVKGARRPYRATIGEALASRALENDLLEQAERFFLLVEQGRGIEKFELDALDRPFDFHVSRDVADFCQHALSFRADDVVVEE